MNARELLDKGELVAAIESLTNEIKAQPSDLSRRTFLFELLCFAGDLVRARKQLDVIGQLSGIAEVRNGVQVYQDLLAAETARVRLFEEGRRPRFLLAPTSRAELHLEALDHDRQGRLGEARAELDRAAAETPLLRGVLEGADFDEIRDGDDLLAAALEVYSGDGYYWVPWEHIQYLEVPKPRTLRDLLWTPARLATFDGQLGEVFLPNLYPGSSTSGDDLLRLGRKTEWLDSGSEIVRGAGRKVFLIGEEARTLLELGEVRFAFAGEDTPDPASAPAGPSYPRDNA